MDRGCDFSGVHPPYQAAQWLKWGVEELVRGAVLGNQWDHPGQVFRAGLQPQICAAQPGKTLGKDAGCTGRAECKGARAACVGLQQAILVVEWQR